ncbi:ThrRS/AlaRS common domain-containing protein [Sporormia fimetaria CBS 119925]|uniref:ThrRS/AlaRS common domain-containing protein n=1 Tax=Sporormia fimetaria CBS 119925 TaxID=1340428 RepID=A0A6A6VAI9_9PLEO|nr:ThrRS/AlaRS common domain-containing protein [Sporormia fimetaria CBS 119925]
MATVAIPSATIVGALACQKDSYLKTLDAEVVSCEEYIPPAPSKPSKAKKTNATSLEGNASSPTPEKSYLLQFTDSVLFPTGGGQPCDHGSITPLQHSSNDNPIPIRDLQRRGLQCLALSPVSLSPGTHIQQSIDFARRWDHMQQHTGQHLLSAIFDTLDLDTLSWSMGAAGEMNYLELPRRPTDDELQAVQQQCNQAIRDNHPITVETGPNPDADHSKLPDDYDPSKGIIRYIRIGMLDHNPCCGTHLKQTSHIGAILLHHMQTIRGTNCRLFFTCGDRALEMARKSIESLKVIGGSLSTGSTPEEVQGGVQRTMDALAEERRRTKKLLSEIASFEGRRMVGEWESGKSVVWCHRPNEGLDFLNVLLAEVKEALAKEKRAAVLSTGQERAAGSIVIVGDKEIVESLSAEVKRVVSSVKGGGKGEKWQGKVTEWKKGELQQLEEVVKG